MKQRYRTLADYIEQTGTTQGELAERLGVDRSYISYLVARKRQPTLPLALRLSKLTGVPLEAMVCSSEQEVAQ